MNVPGIQPDGDSVRIKYATLGMLAPLCAVLMYVAGWLSSHAVFSGQLANLTQASVELRAQSIQSQARENALHEAIVADRFSDSNRLVKIEGSLDRIVQDIAEIKAFPREPKR